MQTYLYKLLFILICLNLVAGSAVAAFFYYETELTARLQISDQQFIAQSEQKAPPTPFTETGATSTPIAQEIAEETSQNATSSPTLPSISTPESQASIKQESQPNPVIDQQAEIQALGDTDSESNYIQQILSSFGLEQTPAESEDIGTLSIPNIELNSDIANIPIVNDQWQIKDLGANVGLLEGTGRSPQENQSMVFAGHAAYFWPIRGPFADLKKLVPGDEITYIVNNKKYSYEVSRLLFADPSRVDLILKDDGDQIILVTCGEVDFSTGLSKDRLIVSADLVSVEEFQLSRSN